jgi:hypothetical protein
MTAAQVPTRRRIVLAIVCLAFVCLGAGGLIVWGSCLHRSAFPTDRAALEKGSNVALARYGKDIRSSASSLGELQDKYPDCCRVTRIKWRVFPDASTWIVHIKMPPSSRPGSTYWYTVELTSCGEVAFVGRVS